MHPKAKLKRIRAQTRARTQLYRASHPILALYQNHSRNARRRGKVVLWDFEEFKEWCEQTGHHILVQDGFQIHRRGDAGPYCADNCESVPAPVNRRLQEAYKRYYERPALAEHLNALQQISRQSINNQNTKEVPQC